MTTYCTPGRINNSSLLTTVVRDQSVITSIYFGLSGFVSIPLSFYIGAWSDRFGRKRLLLLQFLLYFLSQLCLLTSAFFIQGNIVPLIYLSAVLDGILGGAAGTTAIACAYIADITAENDRTSRTAVLEAMSYVGGSLGCLAVAASQDIPFSKYELTFVFLAAVHFCIMLYTIVYIKETVLSGSSAITLFDYKHATECAKSAFRTRTPPIRRRLLLLSVTAVLFVSAGSTVQNNLTFSLLKRSPLEWETSRYGLFSALVTATSGFGLLVVLPLVLHIREGRIKDSYIVVFGCLTKTIGMVLLASATRTWVVFLTVVVFTFGEYALPSLRSFSSKIVDADEEGAIFSFLAVTQNIAFSVASYWFGFLFSAFPNFPGLTFYIGAVLNALIALVFVFVGFSMESREGYTKIGDEDCEEGAIRRSEPAE